MNIFVCIKQVPDTETKIKLLADSSGIDPASVKWVINPYDEFAIEEALKIKEAKGQGTVTVIGVGPARVVESLRTALAMGADEAVLVQAGENLDNLTVAKALAGAIKVQGTFDLILTGKLAIDDNQSAVPQMVAELLQIPHVSVVSKLTLSDANFTAEREVEGGEKQVFEVKKPALIAANKGLNMPRYASLPGIMKAKKKPIKEITLESLSVSADAKISYSKFQLPPEKPPGKIIAGGTVDESVKQLAELLRNEAKVL